MTTTELKALCLRAQDVHGSRGRVLLRLPGPFEYAMELWPGGPYGEPLACDDPEDTTWVDALFDPKIVLQFLSIEGDGLTVGKALVNISDPTKVRKS